MEKAKVTKRLLSLVLAMMILLSTFSAAACETAKAEENEFEISPCFVTILTETYVITVKGFKATVTASMITRYTTSLQIILELQKYSGGSWETDKMWVGVAHYDCLLLEGSKMINIFADYRLKVTFKADQETSVRYKYP